MKETIEFRINYDYAHLLFKAEEGRNIGISVRVVEISKEDPRYNKIFIIDEELKLKYDKSFYFSWHIKRKYNQKELSTASLLHMKIKTVFEPTGEECGTMYDETVACSLCGANRQQLTPLILKKGKIPKKDIAKTIGGEVIVSEKFVNAVKRRELKGLFFSSTNIEGYLQLVVGEDLVLSKNTITGDNPFEKTTGSKGGSYNISGYTIVVDEEVYVCPKGDTIGLNLLSEPCVLNSQSIGVYDLFASQQKIGVKRGLLRPESIYLCSQAFRNMIEEEKLTGFEFEVAHIEQDLATD